MPLFWFSRRICLDFYHQEVSPSPDCVIDAYYIQCR